MNELSRTYFAPPARDSSEQIIADLKLIVNNPILDTLMTSVGGLVAVLNDKRQILMVNQVMLNELGIQDIECILGQRLGETVKCVHADEMEAGCGTSKYCATCGAAISMVTSLNSGEPVEATCHIETEPDGQIIDLSFNIRACPLDVEGYQIILIFLQDISSQERWKAMERIYFHDMNNIVTSIYSSSELLKLRSLADEDSYEMRLFTSVLKRLTEEVAVQRILCENKGYNELMKKEMVSLADCVKSLEDIAATHPEAEGINLIVKSDCLESNHYTNRTLLVRILTNMLINACEASDEGDDVVLEIKKYAEGVHFSVWNKKIIPEEIALRVFQRNYSTKIGNGRGLGTFSMKLFGEKIMGGKVGFTSKEGEGTVFNFHLPHNPETPSQSA